MVGGRGAKVLEIQAAGPRPTRGGRAAGLGGAPSVASRWADIRGSPQLLSVGMTLRPPAEIITRPHPPAPCPARLPRCPDIGPGRPLAKSLGHRLLAPPPPHSGRTSRPSREPRPQRARPPACCPSPQGAPASEGALASAGMPLRGGIRQEMSAASGPSQPERPAKRPRHLATLAGSPRQPAARPPTPAPQARPPCCRRRQAAPSPA